MPDLLHKKRWIAALGSGILGMAFGSVLIAYSISVLGYFFIGFGLGYVICSSLIRDLEKKIP